MVTSSGNESGDDRPRWLGRLSLRSRMVLIAATAVATIVAAGGVLLVTSVRSGLFDTADQLGEAQADQLAQLARRQNLPAELSPAHEVEVAAQVVRGGRVISATSNAGSPSFFDVPVQKPGSDTVVDVARLPGQEGGPFRVTALGTQTPRGPVTIFVAVDVESVDDAMSTFVRYGVVALVLMTLAVGGVCWLVIGRTLAPVDAISRQAEHITGRRLDERVPEPRPHDEIRRLARTINDMLARLELSARQQDRFVADAAHELRTPLATLRLRLETALDRADPVSDEELLPDLLGETLRLGSLVDELLLLARSDAGRLAAQVEPVDLDDVVTSVVASTQDRRVAVREGEMQPVQVLGEPALLEQVVRNLVENAVRHARAEVDVSLTASPASAVITVDDDGPGIPPDARSEVFERFVRLDDSRARDQGGVGLGLAIVDEIVRLHDGTVEISKSPRAGARFRVLLPAAAAGASAVT